MGTGRVPNPYGFDDFFGCVLHPGPLGRHPFLSSEFPHRTPGPMGVGGDLGAAIIDSAETAADEDENELKLLVEVYGSVKTKSGKKSYSYYEKAKGKKKPTLKYRVDDYVKDRNDFFDSAKAYRDYLSLAREELDADEAKLRKYVEPGKEVRKKVAEWRKAQDVFYAWVRKAYQKSLGESVDIPKLIKSQMSEKLQKALQQVKVDYGQSFQYGGFNPRPMKLNGYRLGTISEHGLGTAVDIESKKNAHIEESEWQAIVAFTGKSLSQAGSKWKTTPKELYDSIKEINDEFVKKLSEAIKETEEAAKKATGAPSATDEEKKKAAAVKANPLKAAAEQNAALKKIGYKFLAEWRNGFFDLPWQLVKELQEEGFLWGATFSHPDLHHFEL